MNIWTFFCRECGPSPDACKHYLDAEVIRLLKEEIKFNRAAVHEIIHLLLRQTGFTIQQVQGDQKMSILGIVAGATETFTATPTPQGSSIPAGSVPVWASSDPTNAPVTPAADGLSATVAVPAGATITGFTLSVQNQDGTFPTSVSVPVTQPAPPSQAGFQIDQVS